MLYYKARSCYKRRKSFLDASSVWSEPYYSQHDIDYRETSAQKPNIEKKTKTINIGVTRCSDVGDRRENMDKKNPSTGGNSMIKSPFQHIQVILSDSYINVVSTVFSASCNTVVILYYLHNFWWHNSCTTILNFHPFWCCFLFFFFFHFDHFLFSLAPKSLSQIHREQKSVRLRAKITRLGVSCLAVL